MEMVMEMVVEMVMATAMVVLVGMQLHNTMEIPGMVTAIPSMHLHRLPHLLLQNRLYC